MTEPLDRISLLILCLIRSGTSAFSKIKKSLPGQDFPAIQNRLVNLRQRGYIVTTSSGFQLTNEGWDKVRLCVLIDYKKRSVQLGQTVAMYFYGN